MAVSATQGVSLELYPGGNMDPRMPAGRWFQEGTATGDVSGGTVAITLEFFAASAPPNTFAFSIDQLQTEVQGVIAGDLEITFSGFALGVGAPSLTNRSWGVAQLAFARTIPLSRDLPRLPQFLGYRADGAQALVRGVWETNTDTFVYFITASGEFWLQEAGFYIGAQQPAGSPAFEASRPVEAQGAMVEVRAGRPVPQNPSPITVPAGSPLPRVETIPGPLGDFVAQPTRAKKVIASPAAAQDPLAELRFAFVATLGALGLQVATIPGATRQEITSNFEAMRRAQLSRNASAAASTPPPVTRAPTVPPVIIAPVRAPQAASRGGAKSVVVNSKPTGRQTPNPVKKTAAAVPTFAQRRFAIARLNMAALNTRRGRSPSINPTGGNSRAGSSTRRDIFENEG